MKLLLLLAILCAAPAYSQTPTPPVVDHLSQAEIDAAVAAKPNSGFAEIVDGNVFSLSQCKVQIPSISLFTPAGWINAQSINARKQYLPFAPTPIDTMRTLTIVSKGCAFGSDAGPVCASITRVALISDKGGNTVIEAVEAHPIDHSLHNGYGATASCSNLISRFAMSDVEKVRNAKGEFMVAIFSGSNLTKTYTVKTYYLKKLGM